MIITLIIKHQDSSPVISRETTKLRFVSCLDWLFHIFPEIVFMALAVYIAPAGSHRVVWIALSLK
jgi:hypothetical protein